MKIVLDRDLKLTRGDYAGNPQKGVEPDIKVVLGENAKITHTPLDLFQRYGIEIAPDTTADNVTMADRQYHEIRNKLLQDTELQKSADQQFLIAVKSHGGDFTRILMEQVTYEIEHGEDIDKIAVELEKMESNALFRAYEIDRENNRITTYASREGIWIVEGAFVAKSAELRSAGTIRTDRAYRSVQDPTKMIDAKRANYPLLEETKALIESGAIKHSFATREQADGTWRDDTPTVYVTGMHFKEEISEEDIKEAQIKEAAAKTIRKETTHVNKPQATKEEAKESIEQNEKEIHTKHEISVEKVKQDQSIAEAKEAALKSYVDRLFAELEAKHKKEAEELKQKMQNALGVDREKATKTFLTSLANGMTVTEAIDNLKAAKHNEVLIEVVLEDIKTDMLLTKEKDEIIAKTSKELDSTSKELDSKLKQLEQVEKANKTNHDNYVLELNKRKEAEVAIGRLKDVTEKMRSEIVEQRGEIADLREAGSQKDIEIAEKEAELESQFEQITAQKKEIDDIKVADAVKADRLQKAENEIAKVKGAMEILEKAKEEAAALAAAKDAAVIELTKRTAELEAKLEREELVGKTHKEQIKHLQEENAAIKAELEAVRAAKITNTEAKNDKLKNEIAALKGEKKEEVPEETGGGKQTKEKEIDKLMDQYLRDEE